MRPSYKFSLLLLSSTMFLGCSEKSFTLQSYADKYFNNKTEKEEVKTIETKVESKKVEAISVKSPSLDNKSSSNIDETINSNIKTGPGADVAWSSTYKKDKNTQGQGALQKSLDEWTKKEWEPAFEGDVAQEKEDEAANKNFTLQHYVDKVGKYMKRKEEANAGKPKEPANYEKLNNMPVIGK